MIKIVITEMFNSTSLRNVEEYCRGIKRRAHSLW